MELMLSGVTKNYGHFTALQDFTYVFKEGVYGLLGPNGAGKSTLMNLITGNLSPDRGEILLDGKNIKDLGISYRVCPSATESISYFYRKEISILYGCIKRHG